MYLIDYISHFIEDNQYDKDKNNHSFIDRSRLLSLYLYNDRDVPIDYNIDKYRGHFNTNKKLTIGTWTFI